MPECKTHRKATAPKSMKEVCSEHPSDSVQSASLRFMSFPPELRIMVYSHFLDIAESVRYQGKAIFALTLVSKTIRQETLPLYYARLPFPISVDEGKLDSITEKRLGILDSLTVANFSQLRLDISSPRRRFPSGILRINPRQQERPILGKSTSLTCHLLLGTKYSIVDLDLGTAEADIVALIAAVFRGEERSRLATARIRNFAKALYHMRSGFAKMNDEERQAELVCLLGLS